MLRIIAYIALVCAGAAARSADAQTAHRWKARLVRASDTLTYVLAAESDGRLTFSPAGSRANRPLTVEIARFDSAELAVRTDEPPGMCTLRPVALAGYSGECTQGGAGRARLSLEPGTPGMLLRRHEETLVSQAAPPHVVDSAEVVILSELGYESVRRGTNGFVCLGWRPTLADFWPICLNAAAAKLVIPLERDRLVLLRRGLSRGAIDDSTRARFRRGEYPQPDPGGFGYMLSPAAWTYSVANEAIVHIGEHVHVYMPFATNDVIGIRTGVPGRVPMRVEREGMPDASLVVAPAGAGARHP